MPNVERTEGAGSKPVDLAPQAAKAILQGCAVIDLGRPTNKPAKGGHTVRLVEGLGYDWRTLQLGEATESSADPTKLDGTRVVYEFSGVDAGSVTVHVHTVPVFPLYQGKGTRFGISVDGQTPVVAINAPREFSKSWKDQVLQNGTVATARFAVKNSGGKHTLTLTCGDPGVLVQRIVIDWGGLKETYVGSGTSLLKTAAR